MKLEFMPVDESIKEQVLSLHGAKGQEGYVESVAQCLKEAQARADWRPVGIFAQGTLVGFAMYGYFKEYPPQGRVWLDRFLICEQEQHKGYGKAAVQQLTQKLLKEYQVNEIYLSVVEGNEVAESLYTELGYHKNGELDEYGEHIMVYQAK